MLALLLALQIGSLVGQSAQPIAVVNIRQALAESTVGKSAIARVNALRSEKEKTLAERQAALDDAIKRNLPAASLQRMRIDLQRLTEDAEAEISDLTRTIQDDFEKRLAPVLKRILEEDHLGIIIEVPNPIVVWAHPSIDVTAKAITLLDKPGAPEKQ